MLKLKEHYDKGVQFRCCNDAQLSALSGCHMAPRLGFKWLKFGCSLCSHSSMFEFPMCYRLVWPCLEGILACILVVDVCSQPDERERSSIMVAWSPYFDGGRICGYVDIASNCKILQVLARHFFRKPGYSTVDRFPRNSIHMLVVGRCHMFGDEWMRRTCYRRSPMPICSRDFACSPQSQGILHLIAIPAIFR